MISYDPTVAGNLRQHTREIRKLATAPMGPVALTPGMGHIRLNDGTNDTGFLDFNGVQVRYRGGLRGLTELTESFANSIEAHTNLLSEHAGRLNGHDTTLGQHGSRLDGHDSTLSSHNTRISNAQSRADSAWTRAGTGISNAATAQSRADSAWTRAGTGISNAATAQARADAAYQLANGRATKAEVAAAEDKAENARLQALSVQNALVSWINAARNEIPGLPPPPGF